MNRTIVVLTAVLSLLVVAAPAGAAGQPKIEKAYFKVTLEGVQRDKWDNLHQGGAHRCDATVASKGSEVVKFRSRPVNMVATYIEGLSNPVLRKDAKDYVAYPFKLSGTIARQSSISVSPIPRDCSGTGGGQVPAKDCGTKSFRGWRATVDYFYGKPAGFLQAYTDGSASDPFKNCGPGTQGYPHMLRTQTDNTIIAEQLPRDELFDKKIGKIIVIARGKRVQKGSETLDTASIRWEATFKRLKR
jgi:hypothetical protein